jgi:hypothetical protein
MALSNALYSDFVLDLDTVACFLALQDTRFDLRYTVKPLVDLWSSRQHVQSASDMHLLALS